MRRAARLPAIGALLLALAACKSPPSSRPGEKVLRYPLRARVGTLDPVKGESMYQNMPIAAIFDTLVEFRYPRRPLELRTSLLTRLPDVSEDGRTYTFELLPGVHFADDPAFVSTGGKGAELTTDEVFYSLRRHCDPHWNPSGYWMIQGRIAGLDAYKEAQLQRRREALEAGRLDDFHFDYDVPIEGFRKIDDHHFQIVLTEPFPQFLYILTMGYMSIVPRAAVETYDLSFGQHPVGSGPFRLLEFFRGSWLTLERNPTYRDERVPDDLDGSEIAAGLGDYRGKRLPLLDRIVLEIYQQDQPMWLKFRAGDLDVVQVPAEYWPTVFTRDARIRPEVEAEGIGHENLPLLDLIYWGFNMEDPVWGQPNPKGKLLRKAIAFACDLEARNQAFYNNQNTLYDGPIPPGLDGYQPGFRKRDLAKARALLAEAGHPMGRGLPPLVYETSKGGNNQEQAEMLKRQLAEVGIVVEANFNSFPELADKMNKRKAPFFGLAWGADYPDAENFLQLFYGPNASPGSNSFNYANPEYDRLFEQAKVMMPGPERNVLYARLRDIVLEDQPMIGSMARTRYYLWQPRVRNMSAEEVYYSWWKYLDVAEAPAGQGGH